MYEIKREGWGYRLRFSGFIRTPEMETWKAESERSLKMAPATFGVYVDMHDLKPLAEDTQGVMVSGQQLYKKAGMTRSAVLVDSANTAAQFRRLAKESGIYAWERYFHSQDAAAEQKALRWIKDGVDPDQS